MGPFCSRLDLLDDSLAQGQRRLVHQAELGSSAEAGHLQEDLVYVLAQVLVGRQQGVVGVQAGCDRMVVACTEVRIAVQALLAAADDQHHLGVGFVSDHAVQHLGTGLLQPLGQLNVGFFVEACAQFDDYGDLLARPGRRFQDVGQVGLEPGPVDRLLDGDHLGIRGSLAQEPDGPLERIERVVQQDVLPVQEVEQPA